MTAAEAKQLVDLANKAGIVHAVTFGYRGNPLVQHARAVIAAGEIGKPNFIHGHYLQDWLLKDTDYSWRLEPDKSGESSALGDIGSHWCDLAQHISGLQITHVLGDITTVIPKRKKPKGAREAFQAAGKDDAYETGGHQGRRPRVGARAVRQRREGRVLGRPGVRGPQERSAPRGLRIGEVAAVAAGSTRTSSGSATATQANEVLQKDPGADRRDPRAGYAHLPGGHQEGWPDANFNLMRDIYGVHRVREERVRAAPAARLRRSRTGTAPTHCRGHPHQRAQGSVWTEVTY